MNAGISRPINSFGGVAPYEMYAEATNGSSFRLNIGDLVVFDLCAKSVVYTVAADIQNPRSDRCGFNVVTTVFKDGDDSDLRGGLFGIVMRGGNVGERVKVCLKGIVTARLVTIKYVNEAVTNFPKGSLVYYSKSSSVLISNPQPLYDLNGDSIVTGDETKSLRVPSATTEFLTSNGFPPLGVLLSAVSMPATPALPDTFYFQTDLVTVFFDGLVIGSNRG